jgi:hypothetical protein
MSWFFSKSFTFDVDAQNYFNQIASAGSSIDSTAQLAINDFCIGCKADSIWTLLLDVSPLCGANLTAALVKLKKLSAGWSLLSSNLVSGDYSQATGLTGNGTNKCVSLNVLASALTSGNTGMGLYDRSSANSTNQIHGCHANAGPTSTFTLYSPLGADNKPYAQFYSEATSIAGSSAISGSIGWVYSTQTSDPSHSLYHNGSQVATSAVVAGTLPAQDIYFMARNIGGTIQFFSDHSFGLFCITAGMNSTQAGQLYTRVQTLQTATRS